MQPNPPRPGFPHGGRPPTAGGPAPRAGGPNRPAARAHAAAAVISGILALLTAGMFVWYAFVNLVFLYESTGGWSVQMSVNVLGGAVGAGSLAVAAGFTFARRVPGAWSLCALCVLYVAASIFAVPLTGGTSLTAQLEWIFGFDKINGVAIGLAIIFGVSTAITAAIAGSLTSLAPTAGTPLRQSAWASATVSPSPAMVNAASVRPAEPLDHVHNQIDESNPSQVGPARPDMTA